jgi:hypothetical protein
MVKDRIEFAVGEDYGIEEQFNDWLKDPHISVKQVDFSRDWRQYK